MISILACFTGIQVVDVDDIIPKKNNSSYLLHIFSFVSLNVLFLNKIIKIIINYLNQSIK